VARKGPGRTGATHRDNKSSDFAQRALPRPFIQTLTTTWCRRRTAGARESFAPASRTAGSTAAAPPDMKGSIASLCWRCAPLRPPGVAALHIRSRSAGRGRRTAFLAPAGWWITCRCAARLRCGRMRGWGRAHIGCGHNGVVWLNVVVHAGAAHGSTPEQGVTRSKDGGACAGVGGLQRRSPGANSARPDGRKCIPPSTSAECFAAGAGGKINTCQAEASSASDRPRHRHRDRCGRRTRLRAFLTAAARRIPLSHHD